MSQDLLKIFKSKGDTTLEESSLSTTYLSEGMHYVQFYNSTDTCSYPCVLQFQQVLSKLDEKQKSFINSPFFCLEFESVSRIVKIVHIAPVDRDFLSRKKSTILGNRATRIPHFFFYSILSPL